MPICCIDASIHLNLLDIIDFNDKTELVLHFGEKEVLYRTTLNPSDVTVKPTGTWNHEESMYYTLVLIGPNLKTLQNTKGRHVYWMVRNIRGSKIEKGEVVVQYTVPEANLQTQDQDYSFLLFTQMRKSITKWRLPQNHTPPAPIDLKRMCKKFMLKKLVCAKNFKLRICESEKDRFRDRLADSIINAKSSRPLADLYNELPSSVNVLYITTSPQNPGTIISNPPKPFHPNPRSK